MKILLALLVSVSMARAASTPIQTFGYPLIPDLVADPSITEIDGTFYCYATTDGWGQGLRTSGTPVVWKSTDFLNWWFVGSTFPADFDAKYWAPSGLIHANGRYYSYPTLDGKITAVVADKPEGPFHAADGKDIAAGTGWTPFAIPQQASIDAEIFIDDDAQAYMIWSRRRMIRLKPDMLTTDGTMVTLQTKRSGYTEGPIFFKRKGIYYYLYTLGGGTTYQYAYMMSHASPLGPWEAPADDIIATTDMGLGVYGPGHGCVVHPAGLDEWIFVYLEYGRGSTNRQIYANRMEFNEDGTIKPIKVTKQGVGQVGIMAKMMPNLALGGSATASSTAPDFEVRFRQPGFQRTEDYVPGNAIDGSNGTRWMSTDEDTAPWWELDLGAVKEIHRTEAYFVKPAAGTAYRLESSVDGKTWQPYGGHENLIVQSPHIDMRDARARYLRVTITKGIAGIWEFRVY